MRQGIWIVMLSIALFLPGQAQAQGTINARVQAGDGTPITDTVSGRLDTSAQQAGTWNLTNISGTISLPTGAATETTLGTRLADATFTGRFPSAFASADNIAAQTATAIHGLLFAWDSGGSNWDRLLLTAGALHVNVQNASLPVTQSGAWTVTANAGSGTFAVSGTVTANQGGAPWSENLTQLAGGVLAAPVDADTGAGTEHLIGINLRKRASGGSVEAGTATDPLRTDPTGTTTQPVSGTVTANISTFPDNEPFNLNQVAGNAINIGTGAAGTGTARVAVANDSKVQVWDGTNTASVNASGQVAVNCANCSGSGVSQQDNTAFTGGSSNTAPTGFLYDTTPPTITDGSQGIPRMDSNRLIYVRPYDGTNLMPMMDAAARPGFQKITDGTDTAQVTATGGGSLQVECSAGCGGGTQYNQGTVAGATDALTMAGAIRRDTAALDAGVIDGDRAALSVDSAGRLRTTSADTTQPVSGTVSISGSVTVTDGAGALNVIVDSGSITANAGTNLNTSALALESGGNLATIASVVDATGTTVPANAAFVAGTDGTNTRALKTDASGELQVDILTLPANASVNVAQMNGVATTMGNGVSGTGVQRVTIASDSTGNIATIGTSVTPGTSAAHLGKAEDAVAGSGDTGVLGLAVREDTPTATAANGDYIAPKTNQYGHQFVASICNDPTLTTSAVINATASGNTELVALTASQTIYVCGYNFISSGVADVRLVYGTGTACATGETGLTGLYPLVANTGIAVANGGAIQTKTASGNALCIESSAAVNVRGMVTYAKGAF